MKFRSRKRALVMFLLLTGGAIVNVAMAWECVLSIPNPAREYDFSFTRTDSPARFPKDWHSFANDWLPSHFSSFGISTKQYERVGMTGANSYNYSNLLVQQIWAGWPTKCVWCEGFSDEQGFVPLLQFDWSFAVSVPELIAARRMTSSFHSTTFRPPIPICPLWPGFAINTVFYAAMLWLLFAGPGFIRRRIRARRGQCPACAYPIGTSNVCTECGRPLR